MLIDIIFLAKNRLEYTKASLETLLKNTNWSWVRRLVVYDDNSTDGTREYLLKKCILYFPYGDTKVTFVCDQPKFGGPASVTTHYVTHEPSLLFAKIDNDVIVPPNWLDDCLQVMVKHKELDLLGIEPPLSRVPHFSGGIRNPQPENTCDPRALYAPCDSIGGIGLMRTAAFLKHPDLTQHSTYGGFTEWQIKHRDMKKGWINPPLNVFLLDRLPIDPWVSLGRKYIAEGNQRAWSLYPLEKPFWRWWNVS